MLDPPCILTVCLCYELQVPCSMEDYFLIFLEEDVLQDISKTPVALRRRGTTDDMHFFLSLSQCERFYL